MTPVPLRIVTWNVLAEAYVVPGRYDRSPAAVMDPPVRRQAIVDRVCAMAADLICLQEAEPGLVDALRSRGEAVVFAQRPEGRPDGCATVVRSGFPMSHRVADLGAGHVALLVDIDLPGAVLTVVNTHIRWEPPGTPPDIHLGVAQVRELVRVLPAGPVVLCGDTNDQPGGLVRSLLAVELFTDLCGEWPTAVVSSESLTDAPQALDVIAVRGVTGALVEAPVVPDGPLPDRRCPSDHLPVFAAVDLTV